MSRLIPKTQGRRKYNFYRRVNIVLLKQLYTSCVRLRSLLFFLFSFLSFCFSFKAAVTMAPLPFFVSKKQCIAAREQEKKDFDTKIAFVDDHGASQWWAKGDIYCSINRSNAALDIEKKMSRMSILIERGVIESRKNLSFRHIQCHFRSPYNRGTESLVWPSVRLMTHAECNKIVSLSGCCQSFSDD